jgi:hypothetical protein
MLSRNGKKQFIETASSLPKAVKIVPVCDCSNLISVSVGGRRRRLHRARGRRRRDRLNHAVVAARARRHAEGRELNRCDLYDAIMGGPVERVRPNMMTVVVILPGLLPAKGRLSTGRQARAERATKELRHL